MVWGSWVMSSAWVSLKKRMFRGREGRGTGPGEPHPTTPTSWSRLGKTSITSDDSLSAASVSSLYESSVGLNRRSTEGEAAGLGRLGRAVSGGLGEPSCFFLVTSPGEEQSRAGNTVWEGGSVSLSASQLGNLCFARRTSSSMSLVQLALPEGELPELALREEEGESCERAFPPDNCRGREVGLALREETLEWRPFLDRCCCGAFAALSVTGCRAEEEELCKQLSRLEEKGLSTGTLPAWGLEEEVTMAGLLPIGQPLRTPAAAKLLEVGVVGISLRLDRER